MSLHCEGKSPTLLKAKDLNDLVSRVDGIVSIKNEVTETTDLVERLDPAIERLKARVTQLITYLPLALIALSVFAIIVVDRLYDRAIAATMEPAGPQCLYRRDLSANRAASGSSLEVWSLRSIFSEATALLSTILGAAGIIGLAIGFAVADTVENFHRVDHAVDPPTVSPQ